MSHEPRNEANAIRSALEDYRRRQLSWAILCLFVMLIGVALAIAWWSHGHQGPSARTASAADPVRIESVEIRHLEDGGDRHVDRGTLGRQSFHVRFGDAVLLRAKLSRPAYCYWIALRPDGVAEICFPDDSRVGPHLTDQPVYPPEERRSEHVYALTDGVGLQSFALLVSPRPLPPFDMWRTAHGEMPWTKELSAAAGTIFRISDTGTDTITSEFPQGKQGKDAQRKGTPPELLRLVEWSRAMDDFDAFEVWSFLVAE